MGVHYTNCRLIEFASNVLNFFSSDREDQRENCSEHCRYIFFSFKALVWAPGENTSAPFFSGSHSFIGTHTAAPRYMLGNLVREHALLVFDESLLLLRL